MMPSRISLLAWTVVSYLASPLLCSAGAAAQEASQAARAGASGVRPAGFGVVSSEFTSPSEVEASLPLLATYGVGFVLDWPSTDIANHDRLALVRKANALGIEVRPWLLLPRDQGYWPNSTNARAYDQSARLLLDTWLAAGLAPATLVVDMELPIARAEQLSALILAGDTDGVTTFLRGGIDRAQYTEATRIYRDLVVYAHSRGFRVELSTLMQVLDDYLDGDDGLRQALNIPVAGIAWDTCTFQLYRTLNPLLVGTSVPPASAYFVFDYALLARSLFGGRAGVGLGVTEPGDLAPDAPAYSDPSQLRQDVDAATLAGIERRNIGVYNLRGISRRAPSAAWFVPRSLVLLPPLPDAATLLTRFNTIRLDLSI
jgi:hypothetical protein